MVNVVFFFFCNFVFCFRPFDATRSRAEVSWETRRSGPVKTKKTHRPTFARSMYGRLILTRFLPVLFFPRRFAPADFLTGARSEISSPSISMYRVHTTQQIRTTPRNRYRTRLAFRRERVEFFTRWFPREFLFIRNGGFKAVRPHCNCDPIRQVFRGRCYNTSLNPSNRSMIRNHDLGEYLANSLRILYIFNIIIILFTTSIYR